ncbi:MAG TPA: hypothetical protein VF546_23525 [Pyrinomonadaceae bacterium]|jgi:hypothetical protein
MKRLVRPDEPTSTDEQATADEGARRWRDLGALLNARGEWLCAEGRDAAPVSQRAGEWELRVTNGRAHFSYWTERGLCAWRVVAWARAGAAVRLDVTRRMGAERATLTLVPRASVRAGVEALRAARLKLCARLAEQACALWPRAEIARVRLSAGARRSEPGRYARIVLRQGRGHVAVTGPVVALKEGETDALLASALLWWRKLNERARAAPPGRLWLVVPRALAEPVSHRLALLRADVRHAVELYALDEFAPTSIESGLELDESGLTLTRAPVPALESLLAVAPRAFTRAPVELSATAARLVALAPEAVDVLRARHGETVRFHGLAFARVRRAVGREHVWFGTGARKELLTADNWPALAKLLDELNTHRAPDAPERRHAFYRAAPEAWLEALLRRDITRLDPGLVLAPLHAQFRPPGDRDARPVDLLALRRDGRLVVIELKVTEDAALPLQGADYWRRVEQHRRAGHITAARLFADLPIADAPPLVYLVAPLLRFHRSFQTLAHTLTPHIEAYRFDLNEDWRTGVRVVRRTRL